MRVIVIVVLVADGGGVGVGVEVVDVVFVLLFDKQYIPYLILLLAEGVATSASRLGNVFIWALFSALA